MNVYFNAACTYFNSEILVKPYGGLHYSQVPCVEMIRGTCFRPVHYFFNGKTLIWNEQDGLDRSSKGLIITEDSYPTNKKNGWSKLKMACLILPGLVVGTIATIILIAQYHFNGQFPKLRDSLILLSEYSKYSQLDKNSFQAPTYELPEDFSPNKSHLQLKAQHDELLKKLTSPDSWNDETIRKEYDELIEEAYKQMVLLFKHAAKKANNDPDRMADLLNESHFHKDLEGENYCRAFYYGLGPIYVDARMSLHHEKGKTRVNIMLDEKWSKRAHLQSTIKPFFTTGTREYRWRQLYNSACDLIDQYNLRAPLSKIGSSFLLCAKPDYCSMFLVPSWIERTTFYNS